MLNDLARLDKFKEDITALINRDCIDDLLNTPDYILADYLVNHLLTMKLFIVDRELWYGVHLEPGQMTQEVKPHSQ